MTCLSNVTSCMPCVASGCYWGQPVSGSTLCVPTKVSLVGQLWRTIVPPLAEDACPSIPTTTTIRPETESSPVCWIFLGMAIALFAILLAVGCLVARFCVFRVDQIGNTAGNANRILKEIQLQVLKEGGGGKECREKRVKVVGREEEGEPEGRGDCEVNYEDD
ncbi:uncharacterized protein LOC118437516 isoform X2 [Folsomia candida]|uniref:uncharacterized protein LOC118437516 isoform X2 n=1 Tax=Folsomia candida TaxID=158441 RepID=UPI0016052DA7|nr:uncharacterized protein LOC118437516 isoform X2 [Folsomia candida]